LSPETPEHEDGSDDRQGDGADGGPGRGKQQ
jgi:hypothetical protein